MKGSPQAPQCGFSAQTVQCLMACGERFAYVDVLSNPDVRANLPGYANWPTFPQLWVEGELVGGCDIVTEMFQSGELKTLIAGAAARAKAAAPATARNSLQSRSGQPPILLPSVDDRAEQRGGDVCVVTRRMRFIAVVGNSGARRTPGSAPSARTRRRRATPCR